MNDLVSLFESIGGSFVWSDSEIKTRLSRVRALVFDWDGVFNNGDKDLTRGSTFSEVDSMGVNMLRFSRWLETGQLPISAVMSGAKNLIASEWVHRERFHTLATGAINKTETYNAFLAHYKLEDEQVLFIYDDVLDFGIARRVGLPIAVRRTSNPMLNAYMQEKIPAAYRTGHAGGNHAVREICELLMGLTGNYETVVASREAFDNTYQNYLSDRQRIELEVLTSVS